MEKNIDKLVSDLKQFKKHANDSSSSFTEIQKKLAEQQEISTLQAQQIKDLENALRHLTSALQAKSSPVAAAGEYKVKSGDSLEKIAKEHGTTIEAIRRENNLSKDTIYPGQKLHIP
ncbi:MAG: LysM peptidoglycan-binding domain-containing protein [Verrucomicrobia bacterium]|nr:LysM peptidoglycan-binding domain-containing protein [Verrucomicrobiota bacterium]MBS0636051.1 LysM peptidoglycan-binding domain-containing protein [Verrucomicrobiota bacterium]